MPKDQQPRRSYKTSRPSASGSVQGSRSSTALDHGHVSCSVPFYPGNRYGGLVSHEGHENKRYYLVRHPTNPAVFTQADQRKALTRRLDPEAEVQSYRGLREVSNAVYNFCLATHKHDVTSAQREASLTEPLRPLNQLLAWKSTPRDGALERERRVHAAADGPKEPPKEPSPVRAVHKAAVLAVASSNEQCSTTSINNESWYVLSDGCVFRDATQAEVAITCTPAIKWLSVDSLESAAAWLLSEGLPKVFFMTSDRWGCLVSTAAEKHMAKHPNVRLRIVASLVEGGRWVKSLGGAV
ncbi:hypothetical protein C8F04DRAFT_1269617 [Mycena alexandri]|uniref:Uncharacterized protein n=1 Tax=Mycena alexandri TaxID=1745969 RepID=A0AAD6SD41_9AGAR|nr:hypothetical protein C8F04DRAFT_1269617 [Mycena alexandri]